MRHVIEITTASPGGRELLATWAGQVARAAWDEDPQTGRQYGPATVRAYVDSGPGSGVDEIDLTHPRHVARTLLTGGVETFLSTLADGLDEALADIAAGQGTGKVEEVARLLRVLAGDTLPPDVPDPDDVAAAYPPIPAQTPGVAAL